MNRRAFLSSLLATAVLDPERLLWTPTKTIFIPKPAGLAFHKDAFTWMTVDLPMPPPFAVGDIITFGSVRRAYIITEVRSASDFTFRALPPKDSPFAS